MAVGLHKLGCRCAGPLTLFALPVLLLYPLALRMQAARNAEPPDMAKAIRKKEALREAKRNKLEKAMKQDAAATKAGETAPAGSIDDRKAKVQVCSVPCYCWLQTSKLPIISIINWPAGFCSTYLAHRVLVSATYWPLLPYFLTCSSTPCSIVPSIIYMSACSVIQVVAYGVGKSTVKEEFEAVVDDEEEGITPDDEAVEDTTVDPMQVPLP